MELWQIALIVIAAIVVVGALVWTMNQRKRTEHLTERYGPEYQRTLEATGDKGEAERELQDREERVKEYEIKPLSPGQRDRYVAKWKETQAEFVDDPSGAIAKADALVEDVMGERGYPMGDFEQRSADVSVDHPHVVEEYRAAHAIAERHANGGVETEDLRQAMVHYRALFDDLLETNQADEAETERELTSGAAR